MTPTEQPDALRAATRPNGMAALPNGDGVFDAATKAMPLSAMMAPEWLNGGMARGVVHEMMRFTSQRMHAYAQHLETLTKCETIQAAADTQMKFLRETQAEMTAEMSTMMRLTKPKSTDA